MRIAKLSLAQSAFPRRPPAAERQTPISALALGAILGGGKLVRPGTSQLDRV
jgi:hypothetical protein